MSGFISSRWRASPPGARVPAQPPPCEAYAWCGEGRLLGSIDGEGGLAAVLDAASFRDLACHTVDTNGACRSCALRYLCGGACRAWSRGASEFDLDAPRPTAARSTPGPARCW